MQPNRGGFDTLVPLIGWLEGEEVVTGMVGVLACAPQEVVVML